MFNVIYWVRHLNQFVLQNAFKARLSLTSPKQTGFYSFFSPIYVNALSNTYFEDLHFVGKRNRQREVKFSVKFKCHCTSWVPPKSVTSLQAHLCAILLLKAMLKEKRSNKDEPLPQLSPIRPIIDLNLEPPAF